MRLSVTLAIYLGFFVEAVWLWEAASEKFSKLQNNQIKTPGLSRATIIAGIMLVTGAILIGISELAGENPITDSIDSFLEFILMGAAMFFVLVAGAVGGWLVPRVNEYSITSVLAVVILTTLTQNNVNNPLLIGILIGVPLILSAALALQQSPPTLPGKVILYLLYLGALVFLTIQGGLLQAFQQTQATILEAFVFGSTLSFLALHVLLAIRFLVITTSFVIPFNQKYVKPMMNKLFKDEQIAPMPFFLTLAGLLAAVLINQKLSLFPPDTLAIVLAILCAQLFFRPSHKSEVV